MRVCNGVNNFRLGGINGQCCHRLAGHAAVASRVWYATVEWIRPVLHHPWFLYVITPGQDNLLRRWKCRRMVRQCEGCAAAMLHRSNDNRSDAARSQFARKKLHDAITGRRPSALPSWIVENTVRNRNGKGVGVEGWGAGED